MNVASFVDKQHIPLRVSRPFTPVDMTADRIHQVPALVPCWELSAIRSSRLNRDHSRCADRAISRHEAIPRYRSTVFVSLSYRRFAFFAALPLGKPHGKRLVGLRSKTSLDRITRICYCQVMDTATKRLYNSLSCTHLSSLSLSSLLWY